ncbi:MAG: GNAT family N-acetyltransferase [Crocinitomicaceae bacterium]|nr:GNAT family N-acetyltransferase [Crocinitomicaceae bacterium]
MAEPKYKIQGEKIYLRFVQPDDATEQYLSWLEDSTVMQGLATFGYTLEKLKCYIEEKSNQNNTAFFAICLNDTNQHVGNVKLDFFDDKANLIELGIMIGEKSAWGRGIGFEACLLAMRYGFKEMGVRKIWLAVYENNPGAIRLYEKLGYKHEGRLRKHVYINGEYYDKLLMGIFKTEFE